MTTTRPEGRAPLASSSSQEITNDRCDARGCEDPSPLRNLHAIARVLRPFTKGAKLIKSERLHGSFLPEHHVPTRGILRDLDNTPSASYIELLHVMGEVHVDISLLRPICWYAYQQ
jgi:hypothetical protein